MYFYEIFTAGIDSPTDVLMVFHDQDFSEDQFEEMILDVIPEALSFALEYHKEASDKRLEWYIQNRGAKKSEVPYEFKKSKVQAFELYRGIMAALCQKYGFQPVNIHRYYGLDSYFRPLDPEANYEGRWGPNIKGERELKLWKRVQEVLQEEVD